MDEKPLKKKKKSITRSCYALRDGGQPLAPVAAPTKIQALRQALTSSGDNYRVNTMGGTR